MKKTYLSLLPAITLILFACSSGGEQKGGEQSDSPTGDFIKETGQAMINDGVSDPNIVQVAVGSEDHTTLVTAIQAAGLTDILANNGPFTVFAPTNEAFAKLPEGTVEDLLKPENKKTLINIIYYHAAPGTYKGDLLTDGLMMYQAQGDKVKIERNGDEVTVNGAKILGSVDATNGVIHVVDAVLLPPEK